MNIIIAGSRNINPDLRGIDGAVNDLLVLAGYTKGDEIVPIIVSGGYGGVDKAAVRYARNREYPSWVFYANWNKYGKAAGPIRNGRMAKVGDALVLAWTGDVKNSSGSADMKKQAKCKGIPIREIVWD